MRHPLSTLSARITSSSLGLGAAQIAVVTAFGGTHRCCQVGFVSAGSRGAPLLRASIIELARV
jgi:hypothetical protein